MRGVGLASKTTTVTMPLSPNLCLLLSHDHRLSGFLPASPNFVLHINKLHISGCAGSFVACRNQTRREWFEMPPLPDDAWDKLHPGQVAETMADASA